MICMAVGFMAGFVLAQWINCWGAMWRVCCRDHYLTHPECPCRDCVRDRSVRP